MSNQSKVTLLIILTSASFARADLVIHDLGSTAANTLTHLSKDFVIGCAILAVAIVAAAFVSRKK